MGRPRRPTLTGMSLPRRAQKDWGSVTAILVTAAEAPMGAAAEETALQWWKRTEARSTNAPYQRSDQPRSRRRQR
jgi:hypothetical protein